MNQTELDWALTQHNNWVLARQDNAKKFSPSSMDLSNLNFEGRCLANTFLFRTNLSNANLIRANFASAHLSYTNLSYTDLSHSSFRKASIKDIILYKTKINFSSHELLSYILFKAADTIEKKKIAGFILINPDMCWEDFTKIRSTQKQWVKKVLRPYMYKGMDKTVEEWLRK